jgi:hypothetical protein
MAAFKEALLNAVTDQDIDEVVKTLVGLAKSGHLPAIKLLLDHLIGKPTQCVELTGYDDAEESGISVSDASSSTPWWTPECRVKVAQGLRELSQRALDGQEPDGVG